LVSLFFYSSPFVIIVSKATQRRSGDICEKVPNARILGQMKRHSIISRHFLYQIPENTTKRETKTEAKNTFYPANNLSLSN
jgi:hypothetical protein